ncbi:MAG: OmpH family outer membrane protein [Gammaproteobacteria bacterium]|nr:OmpH family outer membrane protein [Gammaproteobacteria bacterium]
MLVYVGSLSAADIRIGVVDATKIIEQSPQYDRVRKSLDAEFKRRQKDLVAKQKQLKKLEDKLARDGSVMSASEIQRTEKDIRSRRRKIKSMSDEFREDFNIRRNEETNKLLRKVEEVIHQIGEQEKIDVILSEGVVYASDRVNLTEKVLRKLRQQRR